MKSLAQISLGVAGACFAATLTMATVAEWWAAHPIIGGMLGLTMPLCIVAAWMSENRIKQRTVLGFNLIPHSPAAMAIAAWFGVAVGLVALALYLFTISTYLVIEFVLGVGILGLFADVREYSDVGTGD